MIGGPENFFKYEFEEIICLFKLGVFVGVW